MASKNISEVFNKHQGSTIYVLASGASMDYIPLGFFYDKITVGVNQVHRKFPCDYLVSHHNFDCQDIINGGLTTLVASDFDCGETSRGPNEFEGEWLSYHHSENQQTHGIDVKALDDPEHSSLAISASTVADAIHFAHHLGASTIILCGVDSGRIDGKMNFEGYNGGREGGTFPAHLPLTEPLILRLVNELRRRGTAVMSLNPFINPGMEGHKYSRPPAGTVFVPAINTLTGEPTAIGTVPAPVNA